MTHDQIAMGATELIVSAKVDNEKSRYPCHIQFLIVDESKIGEKAGDTPASNKMEEL